MSALGTGAARGLAALLACAAALVLAPAQAGGTLPVGKAADMRGEAASADVRHVANWAVHSGNHAGLPFVIVDKRESQVFVFDAQGRLRSASPALLGAARGDESVPGIGSRPIASIRPEERTTPAGRFDAVMGKGPKGEDILWIDYDLGVALHRVVAGAPRERRLERLKSSVAADRRITYGCINVPVQFFEGVVRPVFGDTRGVVYVLPESRPVQEQFGSYEVRLPLAPEPGAPQSMQ